MLRHFHSTDSRMVSNIAMTKPILGQRCIDVKVSSGMCTGKKNKQQEPKQEKISATRVDTRGDCAVS